MLKLLNLSSSLRLDSGFSSLMKNSSLKELFFVGRGFGALFAPAGGFLFEAGSRPGGRLPFLDSPRKVRSKKATRMSTSLRFAAGNLRRAACGVRRETLFALRATFKQSRQVR
ncbi:hypothetical protein [Delftia sp. JD2]|uniref:hypothetical protein n=1 Tax=Delftia sp. JD2 TaxID=469553 RepID=UPI0011119525|nr:hypothetical protein [Delftia sp. JD2]